MKLQKVKKSRLANSLLVRNKKGHYLHRCYLDDNNLTVPIIWTSNPSEAFMCHSEAFARDILSLLERHEKRLKEVNRC